MRFSAGALTGLNLAGNQIRDAEGAAAIAEALRGNAVLKNLSLTSNEIGDEGATAIAPTPSRATGCWPT